MATLAVVQHRRGFVLIMFQYGLFFASAGHASLIDYPDAKGLQQIAADIYADGGIVSAV